MTDMPPQPQDQMPQQPAPSGQNPSFTRFVPALVVVAVLLGLAAVFYWAGSSFTRDSAVRERAEPLKVGILQNVKHLDPIVDGFKAGLTDLGYEEGVDILYEYQNADGSAARAEEMVRSYMERDFDLMFILTPPPIEVALRVTDEAGKPIPIVFTNGYGLVEDGVLESYQSSGTHVTGVVPDDIDVTLKKLEFFRAIKPEAKRVGVFYSSIPGQSLTRATLQALEDSAPALGFEVVEYDIKAPPTAASTDAMQKLADSIKPGDIDAIVTIPDLVSNYQENPRILIELSKRVGAPVLFLTVPRVFEGGLLSYSQDYDVFGRQAAAQADKIFNGVDPKDIPIEFSKKNLLIINMKTAGEFGLTIPDDLLFIADQIISPDAESAD